MSLKGNILAALEQSPGGAVSGQALAARFGVSRNAIWKAVNSLRNEGVAIESAQNSGYRLPDGYDCIHLESVQALLTGCELPVFCFGEVDSTNTQARRLLSEGVPAPFLVLAEGQAAGRGRQGRAFYSPRGAGLYLTLVLAPTHSAQDALGITAYAAVCVAKAVEALCGQRLRIKWVNDLYLDGRKVCGILTEATTDFETGTLESLLVGVGLNLRETAVPEELQDIVGFIRPQSPVINALAARIALALLAFDPAKPAHLAEYRARSLTLGRRVEISTPAGTVSGIAEDVDDTGALLVCCDDGALLTVRSGEARFVDNVQDAPAID
jgi:BirA family biotin operon repressor/biotin-[acetyl-CoA-carboxylase] ligase